eukprot:TRINITY_DN848_c0_g2_i3.p1 TRINITY_DN848_c0_g2~~TRINITY_DN848_c0_g2_i3.p1  ORF type:complete len:105 (+),score=25.46 TRINITY_DN848_c0_g2_i3:328-642(+)
MGALELVDNGTIMCVIAQPSNRHLFQVQNFSRTRKARTFYLCLDNFCCCSTFAVQVLTKQSLFCKHILGARISHNLGKCSIRTINDPSFSVYIEELTTKNYNKK